MKFYKEDSVNFFYWDKIKNNKLSVIYFSHNIWFFKNGKMYNNKNASYIRFDGYKKFYLNNNFYGDNNDFTKKSWRKFVKLQAFL
jgi:hypothetical protein